MSEVKDATPSPTSTELRWIIGIPAGLVALVFFSALVNVVSGNNTKHARDLVAYQLRDPSSAQFHKVFTREGAVCGQVNGKNGFGAYVGFKRFYVVDDKVTIEPMGNEPRLMGLPTESETFDLGWRINCGAQA